MLKKSKGFLFDKETCGVLYIYIYIIHMCIYGNI